MMQAACKSEANEQGAKEPRRQSPEATAPSCRPARSIGFQKRVKHWVTGQYLWVGGAGDGPAGVEGTDSEVAGEGRSREE